MPHCARPTSRPARPGGPRPRLESEHDCPRKAGTGTIPCGGDLRPKNARRGPTRRAAFAGRLFRNPRPHSRRSRHSLGAEARAHADPMTPAPTTTTDFTGGLAVATRQRDGLCRALGLRFPVFRATALRVPLPTVWGLPRERAVPAALGPRRVADDRSPEWAPDRSPAARTAGSPGRPAYKPRCLQYDGVVRKALSPARTT